MVFLRKHVDDAFLCQNIINQRQYEININNLRKLVLRNSDSANTLASFTQLDIIEYFVEEIISYRGNPRRRSSLQFLVKWLNFPDSANSWEPLSTMKDCEALDRFIALHPKLSHI